MFKSYFKIAYRNIIKHKGLSSIKEVGVRKAIWANRKQLILPFLCETVMLVFIRILLSVVATLLLLLWLDKFTDERIVFDLFNPLFVLLLLLLTIGLGVLAGVYPALVLSGFQPVKVLKGVAVSNAKPGATLWLRFDLVVVHFAILVLLIISAQVVYCQVKYLNSKYLGFNKEQIMFFPIRGDNMFENYETFKNETNQVSGVSSASIGYGFSGDLVVSDCIIIPRNGERKGFSVTHLKIDYSCAERRTKEIGIRKGVGASVHAIHAIKAALRNPVRNLRMV